jgi:glycosyltransferase involved in cell wall biosynthesis
MRVCVLTTSFPLYKGIAVGIHVIEKARHLAKLGVEVDVLAPHHHGAARREVIDGIQVRRFRYVLPERWQTLCYGAGIPTNLKRSLWAKLQLPLFLLALFPNAIRMARKSDLIHAHWSLTGLVGVLVGRLLGKPVVVMMHGAEVYVLKSNPVIRFVVEQADYVLCNSSYTLERILEISRPKAHAVVSPGVDTERFRPGVDLSVFRQREPDIPMDRPLVFALGKFIERKGFPYLIDAMALLTQNPAPFLMIRGRGPLEAQLRRRVKERGIEHRVKFLDHIPDDCIPAYYGAADVFALPSIVDRREDTEGLGVVLLEALACGTPCVASRVGGIVDIITEGLNGYLVEPASPKALAKRISRLITDDRLREEMGRQGRESIEKRFAWRVQAQEILDVYRKIVR